MNVVESRTDHNIYQRKQCDIAKSEKTRRKEAEKEGRGQSANVGRRGK
jgi:hypothetical protein